MQDNSRKLASLSINPGTDNNNEQNKTASASSNRFMSRTQSTASNLLKAVSVKFGGGRSTSMSAASKAQFFQSTSSASGRKESIKEDKENLESADTFYESVSEFISEPESSMRNRMDMERKRAQAARFPVSLWSMASEQDAEIEDSLTKEQQRLKEMKNKISLQSKRNFLLERDVRYLDSRIALLIQNRMALDDDLLFHNASDDSASDGLETLEDRKKQLYGNLFFLLQTEPRIVSNLVQLITLSEIDTLLQTVMFTLYGNQYDSREEHLLLTMFQTVLKAQFDATLDFGSLLRANTPVSRMMTTYTRRGPGQQYLKHVLTDNINKILAQGEMNLEINPVKIYEQMINDIEVDTGSCDLPRNVTAEEAMAHQDVKGKIAPRVEELMRLAEMFLDTIVDNINEVPYGIRWICKQIRALTKKKFPEVKDMAICSLIGGFFLLRFVNPAIVTPQSYMIIDSQPSKNPRRTLTLIAKMLQNVANKPSYAKEEFMMALNPFVDYNKERVCKFLMDLCEVPDFYESIELEQYMALSKKDICINITLNELYNTHSLLTQHLVSVCNQQNMDKSMNSPEKKSFAVSCDHLKTILSDLGVPHQQVSRSENRTLNLNLFSRWESTPVLFPNVGNGGAYGKEANALAEADIMYMNTKSMIVHILRKQSMLISSAYVNHVYMPSITIENLPEFYPGLINIEEILEKAATQCKDSSMVKDSLKVRQNLRILEERFRHANVEHEEGYESLASEVYDEFVRLRDLKGKIGREIKSLENVYNTICGHNQYLRGQLSSYRAYLQNVRIQASGGNPNPSLKENPKTRKKSSNGQGPVRFSHSQLEKDGVIMMSAVPENRRSNVFFCIEMPTPGSFVIGLHYKGRDRAIVEVEIKLDDLLEKQQDNVQLFDLEYVQLNVNKTLHILNKYFMKMK